MASRRLVPAVLFAGMVLAWGLNYLFVRQGLAYAPPLLLAAARSLLGSVVTAAWLLAAGAGIGGLPRRSVRDALALGVPTTGVFFGLWFTAAEQVLPGEAAILVYTFPLWVALLSPAVFGQRPRPLGLLAVVGGFSGVVLVALPQGFDVGVGGLTPIAELLGGAFAWALGTVLFRWRFRREEVDRANFWQLLGGSALLLGAALAVPPGFSFVWSWTLGVDVLWLGAVGTGFAYAVWYRFLAEIEAARLSTFLFLVPVVALAASAVFFGERLAVVQLVGVALVVASLAVVGAPRVPRRKATAA